MLSSHLVNLCVASDGVLPGRSACVVQGYLAHSPTVGFWGGAFSCERGTPVERITASGEVEKAPLDALRRL